MKDLRSIVVKIVVVSFSLAALLGIATLLGGGDAFGETSGRVLGTTFVVGVESLAVLCYLAVADTRRAALGVVGGVVSLVPFTLSLLLTWGADIDGDPVWRTFGVTVTLAASLAQACLLSAVAQQPRGRVRGLLVATLTAIGVLAALIVVAILADGDLGDVYFRVLGIVAILDVLGTVLVIALQKFTGGGPAPAGAVPEDTDLSPATRARLAEAAQRRGTTPSALVDELLEQLPRS